MKSPTARFPKLSLEVLLGLICVAAFVAVAALSDQNVDPVEVLLRDSTPPVNVPFTARVEHSLNALE
jgi:hypothetical protein